MTAFTPDWLSLREAVDRRSRNPLLLNALHKRFGAASRTTVCELGAGTGALLRALAPRLSSRQEWRLVDKDSNNLKAAQDALASWAERVETSRDGLSLHRDGRQIDVSFRAHDLTEDPSELLKDADLVAASALFDLAAPAWIGGLARSLARTRRPFYASLTFCGTLDARPELPLDAAVAAAFCAHQRSEKGLGGVAAGPDAPRLLVLALEAEGAEVQQADSSWRVAAEESAFMERVLVDFATAAGETGLLDGQATQAWLAARLAKTTELRVGQSDLLATWQDAA